MTEQDFYNVHSYNDKLEPGDKIRIEHSVTFCPEKADMADLTVLPEAELTRLKEASAEQEQIIFKKLRTATAEWERQAATTLRMVKALEYVKAPEVKHTSNQWIDGEYHYKEISNKVYTMFYRIYEDTRYDRALKKQIPVKWEVTWTVAFHAPPLPYGQSYINHSRHIAGQERKPFRSKEEAEKYIQGRIAAYAYLFTELSPPIPAQQKEMFSVNGQLLPGHTVEQERAAVVNELLEFLSDDAFLPEPPAEQPLERPTPQPTAKQKARKPPDKAAPSR